MAYDPNEKHMDSATIECRNGTWHLIAHFMRHDDEELGSDKDLNVLAEQARKLKLGYCDVFLVWGMVNE